MAEKTKKKSVGNSPRNVSEENTQYSVILGFISWTTSKTELSSCAVALHLYLELDAWAWALN